MVSGDSGGTSAALDPMPHTLLPATNDSSIQVVFSLQVSSDQEEALLSQLRQTQEVNKDLKHQVQVCAGV